MNVRALTMLRRGLSLAAVSVSALAAASCGPPPPELTGTIRFQYGCRMDSTCPSGAALLTGRVREGNPPLSVTCIIDRVSSPGTVRFRVNAYRGTGSSIDAAREGVSICGAVPENTSGGMTAAENSKFDLYLNGTLVQQQNSTTCPVFVTGLTSNSIEGQFRCENAPDNSRPPRQFYVSGTEDSQNMTVSPMFGDFQFTTCRAGIISNCL